MRQILATLTLISYVITHSAWADWAQVTTSVPVERLVTNLTARVAENPDDAQAHYTLARIHSMAYALGTTNVGVVEAEEAGGMPEFAPYQSVRLAHKPFKLTDERLDHFTKSVAHYQLATELAADQPLYWLGLAWMLDDGSAFAAEIGAPDGILPEAALNTEQRDRATDILLQLGASSPQGKQAFDIARQQFLTLLPEIVSAQQVASGARKAEIERLIQVAWRDQAIRAYRNAYQGSLDQDLDLDRIGMEGDNAVSFEAGKALVRLMSAQPESSLMSQDAILTEIVEVEDVVAVLDAKPKWITPVVFPINAPQPLEKLTDDNRVVRFDLDGDGEPGLWPWVSADTGILVWTEQPWEPISSGRQLFGSVTWWTAWQNGYQALASLDDDGDGWLAGSELEGIAVWRDQNQNGRSERGEVIFADSFGIARIAVIPDPEAHDGVAAIKLGIELIDGAVLPTYDWTPRRVN